MITIKPTPNYAGVEITGDFYDFDQLYEALHKIVGHEDEHPEYFNARIQILGLCYDLRHAKMGHREYTFIDHGLDEDTMKWMGVVGTRKNLYLSFKVYYPEILFVIMSLHDFIKIYKHDKVIPRDWDVTVTTIQQFQATFIRSLEQILTPHTFKMMLSNMRRYNVTFRDYFTQYIDLLTIRFLNWDKEKRLKNISIMAKRIAEQGEEYQKLKHDILAVAKLHNCPPSEISYNKEYPDYHEIDW